MTKLFIILVFSSLIYLVTYIALPMFLRRKLELLDYNPKTEGIVSWSGGASVLILVGLATFKMQKYSLSKSSEEKQHENHVEREFRLRQQFVADMHTYLFVMLFGVWCTINFVLKVNRDRERCQAEIEGREPATSAAEPASAGMRSQPAAAKDEAMEKQP